MSCLVLMVVLVVGVIAISQSQPIIIKSGINKDLSRHQDDNIYDTKHIKGIANFEGEEGFNRDNESKHVKAQDQGKYNEENGQKKVESNANNFADNKYHQVAGGDQEDFSKKSSNKKGHHKTGYTKSYYKDEGGKTESYFDDAENAGDEYVRNSKQNSYGDAGQHSQRGSDANDRRYLQDQAKKGYYDNAGNYEKDLGNQRDYRLKKYYDNHENQGRRNAANQYGEADRFGEEKYVRGPLHYEQQPYFYEDDYYHNRPKKTITIYEDPRYDGYERYPQYEGDYVQLDVKRPTRGFDYNKYYEPRSSYDYYY